MNKVLFVFLFPLQLSAQPTKEKISQWEQQAKQVTIIRDNFGIPHIYGKSDADAVFGLMYAQCEDDYKRVEMNYLEKLGMLSTVKGESELYNDLLIRMIIDPDDAKADYRRAPEWLRKLCNAWADGINFYLHKNPQKKNLVGKPYEPWFPFLWTDGSIGAINTARVSARHVKMLYGVERSNGSYKSNEPLKLVSGFPNKITEMQEEASNGSNGFAISPKITASGNSILYINPHVTFYFRPEVHMVSEEGLNVYGAVTWGQFFIYQGFNEHCGWMHTSSSVDAADTYIEKLSNKNGKWFYEYDKVQRPVKQKKIEISYKNNHGLIETKRFNILYTNHGPVMAKEGNDYISVRADNRLMNGLIQCWQRTKATSFSAFKKTLNLQGNISNNTVYADKEGNIAYWHGNRIPKRDRSFDWNNPVDGSVSTTEWKGYHPINETIHIINPPNGWLQNCNSTPFTAAGIHSPKREAYPSYMAPDGENFRGLNAVRVLSEENNYTIDKIITAGYDRRLSAFEILIPPLIKNYEAAKNKLQDADLSAAINVLKSWDYCSNEQSVATTLAVHFGEKINMFISNIYVAEKTNADFVDKTREFVELIGQTEILEEFSQVLDTLKKKYGRWEIPWGEINRFQRISSDIDNKFDDDKLSYPVGFVSAVWGMLPSYVSRVFPGTRKRYGTHGNSFVCAVEFGTKIKAKSLLAGGQSGDPGSPHFFDQGLMYSKGEFKDVLFYKEDVLKHAEKKYHPGGGNNTQ